MVSLLSIIEAITVINGEKTKTNEVGTSTVIENNNEENWIEKQNSIKGFIDFGL